MTENFASVIFAKGVYTKVDKQKTLLKKFEPRETHFTTNEGNQTVSVTLVPLWGASNHAGIGLSYRPARLHRLAELISRNRFLGSLKV